MGAEISCVDYVTMRNNEKYCAQAFLHGEIVKGDYSKVALFYTRSYPPFNTLILQSPGGDVIEAIKIGRLLRKYFISAEAPFGQDDASNSKLGLDDGSADSKLIRDIFESMTSLTVIGATSYSNLCSGRECVCASSCALIFFGSPRRHGSVGLHRPVIDNPEFKKLSPAEAERAYKPVLALISQYLEEMEVPREFIEAMIATSSSDIRWVRSKGIERSPSFAEWQDANCGSSDQAANEFNELHELEVKSRAVKLSQAEIRLMSLLQEKVDKHGDCIARLMIENRKKLPPPTLD
jgi:hypothetical protein